ncbi:hypothetical protein AVEN_164201-1 [Araneus ventricosus]|uniref:Uncharacterized protein n=1 Tax=Araneus ventricosus TaxID=182803 RepID=A0A4Y2JNT8_ARAVE|nr:hypothetical protein AVEN_164201-1 [Araneus ventricosus]
MIADYCWMLQRDNPCKVHKRKIVTRTIEIQQLLTSYALIHALLPSQEIKHNCDSIAMQCLQHSVVPSNDDVHESLKALPRLEDFPLMWKRFKSILAYVLRYQIDFGLYSAQTDKSEYSTAMIRLKQNFRMPSQQFPSSYDHGSRLRGSSLNGWYAGIMQDANIQPFLTSYDMIHALLPSQETRHNSDSNAMRLQIKKQKSAKVTFTDS